MNYDLPPVLNADDQIELERLERHAALASFLERQLKSWDMRDTASDVILQSWSADWWTRQ